MQGVDLKVVVQFAGGCTRWCALHGSRLSSTCACRLDRPPHNPKSAVVSTVKVRSTHGKPAADPQPTSSKRPSL